MFGCYLLDIMLLTSGAGILCVSVGHVIPHSAAEHFAFSGGLWRLIVYCTNWNVGGRGLSPKPRKFRSDKIGPLGSLGFALIILWIYQLFGKHWLI